MTPEALCAPDDWKPEILTSYEFGDRPCRIWRHPSGDEARGLGYVITEGMTAEARALCDEGLRQSAWMVLQEEAE
jgi:hypothetical protein